MRQKHTAASAVYCKVSGARFHIALLNLSCDRKKFIEMVIINLSPQFFCYFYFLLLTFFQENIFCELQIICQEKYGKKKKKKNNSDNFLSIYLFVE
jgi:hypothetical protein